MFCPANFVMDTYIGCPHACQYCYSPSFFGRHYKGYEYEKAVQDFRNYRRRLSERDFEKIEKALEKHEVTGLCHRNQVPFVEDALQHKYPLRIGSVSEPLGLPLERQFRDTYRVLELLVTHNYPFMICTKSPLIGNPEYINLLKSSRKVMVQISLISLDQNLLNHLESDGNLRTPPADQRLHALRKLAGEGIFTVCRIQPVIPEVTERGLRDLIFRLAEIGVCHVIVEFLWFPQGRAEQISHKLKIALDNYIRSGGIVGEELKKFDNDLYRYYRSFTDSVNSYGRSFFSKKRILLRMKEVVRLISEANREYGTRMSFGSGNEETTFLNSTIHCCGADRINGFLPTLPCTAQTMVKIAMELGRVKLSDMNPYYTPLRRRFDELWNKRKGKRYFLEERLIGLKAEQSTGTSIDYVFDKSQVEST
jgi:DNA repair photolyase